MYTRIFNIWSSFRSSFWFAPSVLLCAATAGALLMITIDGTYGAALVQRFSFLEMSPPAARSILSSIVSAMMSTTGVVFSITIVALSLSSSQFGSRLIRTYRNHRTTQYTLGIFVSTSLYCIVVLASIRETQSNQFVPSASVLLGIILSVVCLAMLVYYIHDMSRAIEAPNVIQRSANDLHSAVKRLFPESIGEGKSSSEDREANSDFVREEADFIVKADSCGYLQAVEHETVMSVAEDNDLLIKLLVRPGDFIYEGLAIAEIFFSVEHRNSLDGEQQKKQIEKLSASLNGSMIVGAERTHVQDIRYAFNEVADIAVRALSPGVNDPFTAINCVDRIQAALIFLRSRNVPASHRCDDDGNLRVLAQPVEFAECVDGSLGLIQNYASGNPTVLERIETALDSLDSHSS